MTLSEVSVNDFASLKSDARTRSLDGLLEYYEARFHSVARGYIGFNVLFLSLLITEVVLFAVFFTFLIASLLLAVTLAALFFTTFCYYVLRTYFQTRKDEQFRELAHEFLEAVKGTLTSKEGAPDFYVAVAGACCRMADALHCREYSLYGSALGLRFLKTWLERLSCWLHWQDIHRIKELFLELAVQQNIDLVKCEPTNLAFHAALANAYVMISALYVDPRTIEGYEEDRWLPKIAWEGQVGQKFRYFAERAIEEFKILNEYAPNDPWVHAQLAYSYRDLQMPIEEIHEYEVLLKLNPDDKETLYRLGVLYFQQGMNAQGLRVYEELKRSYPKRAEQLVDYYGAYSAVQID